MNRVAIVVIVSATAVATAATDGELPYIAIAPDHWTFELRGGMRAVRSGKHALQVLAHGPAEVVHDPIAVQAGQALSAEAWHCGSGSLNMALRFMDAGGNPVSAVSSKIVRADAHWNRLALDARAPVGSARAAFVLQVGEGGQVSFDDASLSLADNQQLANPGFEDGLRGWEPARDGTGAAWVNGTTFVPWGFNYDRTIYLGRDIILEEAPIEKIDRDFRQARKLGANAIRLFLQFSRFMPRYLEMDPPMLDHLDRVVACAHKYDLKLDITGLSYIVGAPGWIATHSTEQIQAAERHFWDTLARRYAGEPIIFAFDLQNEPVVQKPDSDMRAVGCFKMSEGRQFCYVNPHRLLDNATRQETARQWTAAMVQAIHARDSRRLVTIGMLPTAAPVMGFPNPGFDLPTAAPLLDYISLHYYPNRPGDDVLESNEKRLEMLLRFAGGYGKPVVCEEWFPLFPPGTKIPEGAWFPRVMQASRSNAAGWFTFYFQFLKDGSEDQPIASAHLQQFSENAAQMRTAALQHASAMTKMKINPELLWRSKDEVERVLADYRALRSRGELPDFEIVTPESTR